MAQTGYARIPARREQSVDGSKAIAIGCGGLSIALGLAVLAGWAGGSSTAVEVAPGFLAMQPATAFSFLLCGTGLVLLGCERRSTSTWCGGMTAACALLVLVQYAFTVDLGIDRLPMGWVAASETSRLGRMAANTAISFALAGIGLMASSGRARFPRLDRVALVLGACVLSLGVVAMVGYLFGADAAYRWGRLSGMAVHTAAGFAALGVGIIAFSSQEHSPTVSRGSRGIALALGAAALATTLFLYQGLRVQERAQVEREIEVEAARVEERITSHMEAEALALLRMARRWQRRRPVQEDWEADAENYVAHGVVRAVGWADASLELRWVAPKDAPVEAALLKEAIHDQRPGLPPAAAAPGGVAATPVIDLGRARRALLLVAPTLESQADSGFIVGLLDLRRLLTPILAAELARGYSFEFLEAGKPIYRSPTLPGPGEHVSHEREIELYGLRWRLRTSASQAALVGARSRLPEVMLIVGLVLASLLALAASLAESVWQRARDLRSINDRLKQEASERARAEHRLRAAALYDHLTGLPNRVLFSERLESALASAARRGQPVALLFLDLDRFKEINDSLGHGAGDRLLQAVSRRLLRSVRAEDSVTRAQPSQADGTLSRLGGDEFTVLLTAIADGQDAARVAARLLDALAEPFTVDDQEIFASASIGIAVFPVDGAGADELLKNADRAMYHAKSSGRNRFEFYAPSMNAAVKRKLDLERRMRRALKNGEFELHYQPQRDAAAGRLTGAEALIRWRDPESGPVSPAEFIPVAEESSLILPIGEWALRTACAQSRSWQAAGHRRTRVSVNVSTRQVAQANLAEVVGRLLWENGLSPADLELEITESAIMDDDDGAAATLRELDEMGIGIVLDDFGTGCSSLSYLRRFPIRRIKIDRSFVSQILQNPEDAALTAAIISMAQSLRLGVVAEGVETLGQAEFLRDHGCHELQGYLFSPAIPARDFVRFLEREKEEAGTGGPPGQEEAAARDSMKRR